MSKEIFLTADWNFLAMLNYEVDPKILKPYVPESTELDFYNRKTFVSIVGFLFRNTRILGWSIPFHKNFEEINLRFYVRYKFNKEWRRGVVFIKEIVPRFAIAYVANKFYNENYVSLPTDHFIRINTHNQYDNQVRYMWRFNGCWNYFFVIPKGDPILLIEGSEEEFITEHYWGYNKQLDGNTLEYEVEHPKWEVWDVGESKLDCDVSNFYGKIFAEFLDKKPGTAFLAQGSSVNVYKGKMIA